MTRNVSEEEGEKEFTSKRQAERDWGKDAHGRAGSQKKTKKGEPYKEFGLLIKEGNGLRSEVKSGGTKDGEEV